MSLSTLFKFLSLSFQDLKTIPSSDPPVRKPRVTVKSKTIVEEPSEESEPYVNVKSFIDDEAGEDNRSDNALSGWEDSEDDKRKNKSTG